MFETKKTLIVVYKDELLMNQLKKLIETRDDADEGIVGTKDDSINVVSWTEKVWLGNKKAGNIQGKILFLGDIKGTDELIPVLDVQFDEYGVKVSIEDVLAHDAYVVGGELVNTRISMDDYYDREGHPWSRREFC